MLSGRRLPAWEPDGCVAAAILGAMIDLVEIASEAELYDALGPARSHGRALILLGGADATEPERLRALSGFFDTVARYAERAGVAVLDGGTDSGVMRLIGDARAAISATFPLIGVAPSGAFERATKLGTAVHPAAHHSQILRVPGEWFGDETRWLFAAADHLGGGSASTIVVNGGALTMAEAGHRLESGHRVIAVEGSGRSADALASGEEYAGLRWSGRLRVMPLIVDAAELANALGIDQS